LTKLAPNVRAAGVAGCGLAAPGPRGTHCSLPVFCRAWPRDASERAG